MFADDITLLRKSRADAVVASIPTLAYAIGAIGGLRMAAYAGIGCAVVVCAIAARRRPLPAVAGLFGVIFAVGIALVTQRPTAFFLPGIALNGTLAAAGISVLHAHGPKNTLDLREPADGDPPYVAVPYLDRMDLAYAAADLAICRSGATAYSAMKPS